VHWRWIELAPDSIKLQALVVAVLSLCVQLPVLFFTEIGDSLYHNIKLFSFSEVFLKGTRMLPTVSDAG
jgi:hypothetical protein